MRAVTIQTSAESVLSPPSWFGEVALMVAHRGRVRCPDPDQRACTRMSRRRFGHYEVIDFLAILFGYAISGERTLEADLASGSSPLQSRSWPGRDRDQLPARSTLSRFLAALTEAPIEALRTLFLDDLLRRPLTPDKQTGELMDRAGNAWVVFDIDGTREAARVSCLASDRQASSTTAGRVTIKLFGIPESFAASLGL